MENSVVSMLTSMTIVNRIWRLVREGISLQCFSINRSWRRTKGGKEKQNHPNRRKQIRLLWRNSTRKMWMELGS